MKKYVVMITVMDNNEKYSVRKCIETFDEMEAFLSAADLVKWAKKYIKEFYGADYEDEADYIISIATKTEEEEIKEESDDEDDCEEDNCDGNCEFCDYFDCDFRF